MADNLLQGLQAAANATSQAGASQYLEELKNSPDGWKLCGDALIRNIYSDETVKFFCFQVLEHQIKTRHQASCPLDQDAIRKILLSWLHNQCCAQSDDENFLKNKAAQVFSLIFVRDYPEQWPSFFSDLLQCLQFGSRAVDMYLRILKAIDEEVVDRDVVRSPQLNERSTKIKDTMRDTCVVELVESWYKILQTYESSVSSLTCLCLDVIGAYIEWIDIGLVANDKFISLLLRYMSVEVLRESACDCIHEIICKGMEPIAKKKLVESLLIVLEQSGILIPREDEDADFMAKLAKLMSAAGTQLLNSYTKLTKSGDTETAAECLHMAEDKLHYMFRFLEDEDDDVSQNASGFGYTYLNVLKQITNPSELQKANLRGMLYVVIKKMKYDESYNFDREGEDEVMFIEYRKEMKILFDNIAQLDPNLVLVSVHNVLNSTFGNLSEAKFMDVEMAVRSLYILGEALSPQQLYSDTSNFGMLQQMMNLLVASNVSYYRHSAVAQMFFETVVRYDRFFASQSHHIPAVLMAFLDDRGLRNNNCTVRSRCAYLFSRFIKSHKANMLNYSHDLLKRLQTLLVISPDNDCQNLLSADDQLFLYESAGILIVSSGAVAEKQLLYMQDLLSPVIMKFDSLVTKLLSEVDDSSSARQAQQLYHLVAYASRASKAFPNQQSLKDSGCGPCFTEALPIFLRALTIPIHRDTIHSGVRQYLHRMIVCLGDGVLPFIPVALDHLLIEDCTARDIQEFIPLINQIIARFKLQIGPLLSDAFMPIVNRIFSVLRKLAENKDEEVIREKETLRRSYFLFVAAIVTNDVTSVLTSQNCQDLDQVLMTLIQGAVEFPDPVAQKISFNILRKLVELWGGSNGIGFEEFIYKSIVPATFMAPMKSTFNLADAQTILTLQEIILTQRTILQKQGGQLIDFLQNKYLPTLPLSPQVIQDYTSALEHADIKTFKNFVKAFFTNLRS
ncbi:exportin-T-like [Acropora millepora]|uniref:exportin-T-like n=1 Tax=Acropora millepora TaxID=45264 RepID=UPI001CF2CAD1|nr:exportin-T-like [Acropora millepora]XP_029201597.2 exportin-T-like [Acropora millepora]